MTNNTIIRTDDDYLRAHITLLRRGPRAFHAASCSANKMVNVAEKARRSPPITARTGKQIKLVPDSIRRTLLPADSRRVTVLPAFRRSKAPTIVPPDVIMQDLLKLFR